MKLEDRLLAYEDQQMTVGNDMDGAILIRDARELIESLRAVARAAQGVNVHWDMSPASEGTGLEAGFYDHLGDLDTALDAVPQWCLEE